MHSGDFHNACDERMEVSYAVGQRCHGMSGVVNKSRGLWVQWKEGDRGRERTKNEERGKSENEKEQIKRNIPTVLLLVHQCLFWTLCLLSLPLYCRLGVGLGALGCSTGQCRVPAKQLTQQQLMGDRRAYCRQAVSFRDSTEKRGRRIEGNEG